MKIKMMLVLFAIKKLGMFILIQRAMFTLLDFHASFSMEGKLLLQVPHWINFFRMSLYIMITW
ncbi:hypothetical protein BG74_01100 [Sodalis-like endosymbiont of Proechinophthirus fluctus]|nr:hypothetical protein BG74_07080 [Sodalis-like endosymbiont of Proechinophthirus fluctus]KYP96954.1 hypothetical protein BG74_06660 [Sodalis-like endosymbiont of Proechinophthirus fluctus]KYP97715.1 hypothetical protein BG74_01100 [Sodalis-like endosymbiont of Proechinophthirus fluctus]